MGDTSLITSSCSRLVELPLKKKIMEFMIKSGILNAAIKLGERNDGDNQHAVDNVARRFIFAQVDVCDPWIAANF